ncbi:hypothetical protein EVAR_4142_1 [Eumeta japonica]|uniref:Uncharacterized protein n=1 Tax=Eumeta variegata TaxID=151549 RepID=A0A4C1TGP6_EUMVA|nr:hypothetical protein EVAR_4142_1 [Eumeta japonica]
MNEFRAYVLSTTTHSVPRKARSVSGFGYYIAQLDKYNKSRTEEARKTNKKLLHAAKKEKTKFKESWEQLYRQDKRACEPPKSRWFSPSTDTRNPRGVTGALPPFQKEAPSFLEDLPLLWEHRTRQVVLYRLSQLVAKIMDPMYPHSRTPGGWISPFMDGVHKVTRSERHSGERISVLFILFHAAPAATSVLASESRHYRRQVNEGLCLVHEDRTTVAFNSTVY